MQVLVKVFLERPSFWNNEGLMDDLMGKIVEAKKSGSWYLVPRDKRELVYTWTLRYEDIIPVEDIPKIEFCEEGLTTIDIALKTNYAKSDMMSYLSKIHPSYFDPIPIEKIQALAAQFPEFLRRLLENKIVKFKEVTYKIGQRFVNSEGEEALLSQVGGREVCLIHLPSANRVREKINVKDIMKITEYEFSKINGQFDFYTLKK